MTHPRKLTADALRNKCEPSDLGFETTAELEPLNEVIGQDRAVRAIEFGVDISSSGFNLFLAGAPGTGRKTILRRILARTSEGRPNPPDVAYVHNFADPDSPRVLVMPAGKGARLRDDLAELVEDLQELIPKAFDGKAYEEQQRSTGEQFQEKKQALLDQLEKEAGERGFHIKSTPMGFRTIPVREDNPLTQEEYQEMPEDERTELDSRMEELQTHIREVMSEVKDVDHALKEELKDLNRQVAMNVLGTLMLDIGRRYRDLDGVAEHLRQFEQDVLENIDQFKPQDEPQLPIPGLKMQKQEPDLNRYQVNLVVDNGANHGAPVVIENNPTYANLVGQVERRAQFGALLTDFTMIRAGSLAKANGGYLVLDIEDVLRSPFSYEALKRSLVNREVRIEDNAEKYGLMSAATVRPEPIPLNVKVCLIGNPRYYHQLFAYDEVFREIFKVKADFDYQVDRDESALSQFGPFVARLVEREDMPPFSAAGVAAVMDESSRFVEDQQKLSLRFGEINDLIREAAYWAKQAESELVEAEHVEQAIREAEYRASLAKERVQELIQREVLMVDTEGDKVGQIKGLAVHMLGDYLFGRPSRITCAVFLGREGVVNIERRVRMSHSTHDKGVLILQGFLGSRFAQKQPLTLTASLTFEQSYAEIAGDSASSTELYVLLSALAEVPIKQGLAVTGSVNQRGEVQAIGGVNHKIEGYFEICQQRGLTGEQGVMIPTANVQNLMLRPQVVDAVERGDFHIWAIEHVDEGIEILTGIPAGEPDEDGEWPEGTINAMVRDRLARLGKQLMTWSKSTQQPQPEMVQPHEIGDEPPSPPKPPEKPPE
ncbi:MAG: AAA family ATPase [Acidobacteria bacterium]|nr:AAA family ATPase [Acidobacteriota bacterium]